MLAVGDAGDGGGGWLRWVSVGLFCPAAPIFHPLSNVSHPNSFGKCPSFSAGLHPSLNLNTLPPMTPTWSMIVPHFPAPRVGAGPKQSQSKSFLGADVNPKRRRLSCFERGLPIWATSGQAPYPLEGEETSLKGKQRCVMDRESRGLVRTLLCPSPTARPLPRPPSSLFHQSYLMQSSLTCSCKELGAP